MAGIGRQRLDLRGQLLLLELGLEAEHSLVQQFADVEGAQLVAGRAAVEHRHLEHAVDQVLHAQRLGLDRVEVVHVARRRDGAVEHALDKAADRGDRRAQVVRDAGDEVAPLALLVLEHVDHVVDRRAQAGEVVGDDGLLLSLDTGDVDPGGQVALRDAVGGLGHAPDRSGDGVRERADDEQRDEQGDDQGQGEAVDHEPGVAVLVADDVLQLDFAPVGAVGAAQRHRGGRPVLAQGLEAGVEAVDGCQAGYRQCRAADHAGRQAIARGGGDQAAGQLLRDGRLEQDLAVLADDPGSGAGRLGGKGQAFRGERAVRQAGGRIDGPADLNGQRLGGRLELAVLLADKRNRHHAVIDEGHHHEDHDVREGQEDDGPRVDGAGACLAAQDAGADTSAAGSHAGQ